MSSGAEGAPGSSRKSERAPFTSVAEGSCRLAMVRASAPLPAKFSAMRLRSFGSEAFSVLPDKRARPSFSQ